MPTKKASRKVAVLGGGPAGLSAAYRLLHTKDDDVGAIRVDIYEASGRMGGVLISEADGGFQYELGPASMNAKHAAVADLIYERLGLTSRVEQRCAAAKNFYLVRNGALLPMPRSPGQFLSTKLLSWRAKLAVLSEPFRRKLHDADKANVESVGDFFERRFSKELVDYVVDPALAGIYSAKPSELSMKHAFERIWTLERSKGSIIGGMFSGGLKTAPNPNYKPYSRKELLASFSFDKGMEVISTSMQSQIEQLNRGGKLYKNATVQSLERDDNGTFRVNGRGRYDAVISTIPTYALGNIYSSCTPIRRAFGILAKSIRYAPVSIVVLGFDKEQIPHKLDGFGALVPTAEGRRILGVNFSSSNFPTRLADPRKVFLTVYVGGSRNPGLPFRPAREVVDLSTSELRHILGVKGEPCFSRVKTWTQGIPQYTPGYDKILCTIARLEDSAPGLILGGNYRDGVGLPDALLSGIKSAERALEHLKNTS